MPLVLAQTACTIEQTPQQYIDHLTTPAAELEASRDELTVRLLSTAPALERADRSSLAGALAPLSDALVVGDREGEELQGPRALVERLLQLTAGSEIEIAEAVVTVEPGNGAAWFRVEYDLAGGELDERPLYFTGVFIRAEGDWRLTQGHLSTDLSPPEENQEPEDTPAAGG